MGRRRQQNTARVVKSDSNPIGNLRIRYLMSGTSLPTTGYVPRRDLSIGTGRFDDAASGASNRVEAKRMLRAGRGVDQVRSGVVGGGRKFVPWLVAISPLVALLALPAGTALAKRIAGTNGADRIVGTKKADRINGRGGKDQVKGRNGADRLKGSGGGDRLAGGKGADRLKGSKGRDRISGGRAKDRLAGGKGRDRLNAVDGKKDGAVDGG